MKNRIHTALALIIAANLSAATFAQDQEETQNNDDQNQVNQGRLSLDLGLDITSSYFFRGYLQEDSGLIAQPWVEVGFDLTPNDSNVDIGLALGSWSSFHSEDTGATGTAHESWYEADFYGGLTFGWDAVELALSYTVYTYPNNDLFNDVHEVGATLTFDIPDDTWADTILGDVSVGVFVEIDNSNVFTDEAMYLQLDFGPGFEFEGSDITLAIPVSVGVSLDDYYVGTDDETFGFASIGAVLDIPLCSGDYGDWSLSGGVNLLLLGDTTEAANNGDDVDGYAFIGVSVSY